VQEKMLKAVVSDPAADPPDRSPGRTGEKTEPRITRITTNGRIGLRRPPPFGAGLRPRRRPARQVSRPVPGPDPKYVRLLA
jgi:hypothetical protein